MTKLHVIVTIETNELKQVRFQLLWLLKCAFIPSGPEDL